MKGYALAFTVQTSEAKLMTQASQLSLRPHPHEPKTITFWDKLAHFSGKISPEKLAG